MNKTITGSISGSLYESGISYEWEADIPKGILISEKHLEDIDEEEHLEEYGFTAHLEIPNPTHCILQLPDNRQIRIPLKNPEDVCVDGGSTDCEEVDYDLKFSPVRYFTPLISK